MHIQVTCGTVGGGTDEDPYRPYVADLWHKWSGLDLRVDPTVGNGQWVVELARPEGMRQAEYDAAMVAILGDPGVSQVI